MQLIPGEGGAWLLIDEAAPPDANLIATVRGPVEVLALKELCEARLRGDLGPFVFSHAGIGYRVTPYGDRGARLSLRIDGDDGSLGRVETEFAFPPTA